MRKLLLLPMLACVLTASAQTVSTFESLPLSKADTFYANYEAPGEDVGFEDGLAYFPCVYDTGWGFNFWSKGFAYSNMTDTITPDYTNMYAARPGKGANNSDVYVVAWDTVNVIHLRGEAIGKPVKGMFVTNSNYAYNSMKWGDPFAPDIFDGVEKEWFKIVAFGYQNGSLKADSVEFYLADFRSNNATEHVLIDTWEWMDLSALGAVDSIKIVAACSDPDKPIYFCLDDFTTHEDYTEEPQAVHHIASSVLRTYPNPARDFIIVETPAGMEGAMYLMDVSGKVVAQYKVAGARTMINTLSLTPGTYIIKHETGRGKAIIRFQKQ